MDIAIFRSSIEQDSRFTGFDLDSFEQQYNEFISKHGEELDRLSAQESQISASRVLSIRQSDPTQLRREILARELQSTGIDWEQFHAGNKDQRANVEAYLKRHSMVFGVDDLLNGETAEAIARSAHAKHPESITVQEAQTVAGYSGDDIKNFVIHKANMYSQLKSAFEANDRIHFVTGMMLGGAMAFGGLGAAAAGHARNSGATVGRAIVAGIIAIGGFEVAGGIAIAVFVGLFALALILGRSSITSAFLNRTESGLAIGDYYNAHGETPIYPHGLTTQFPANNKVVALPEVNLGSWGNQVFIGYWYQKSNFGFNGVACAIPLQLLPPRNGVNGLGSSSMYMGYWIKKFGAFYQLVGINSDPSAHAFWNRHFHNSDVHASNLAMSIQAKMNSYSYEILAKEAFQIVNIHQVGQG